MARRTLKPLFRASLALCFGALAFGAFAPARAQPFFFFWDQPARREPVERAEPRLSARQVRSILAREGAYLVGSPHWRGRHVIAVGRSRSGARRRFILDARSGAVLAVAELAPTARGRRASRSHERAPRGPGGEIVLLPPPASPPPGKTKADEDAALSPVRPIHRRGGPEIDPLPQ
jgi:hypothetical protein